MINIRIKIDMPQAIWLKQYLTRGIIQTVDMCPPLLQTIVIGTTVIAKQDRLYRSNTINDSKKKRSKVGGGGESAYRGAKRNTFKWNIPEDQMKLVNKMLRLCLR